MIVEKTSNHILAMFVAEATKASWAEFSKRYPAPVLLGNTLFDDSARSFKTILPNAPTTRQVTVEVAATSRVIIIEPRANTAFPDRVSVGRTRATDIWINNGQVSKLHAFFSRGDDGEWYLTDTDATNGTFVAGVRLEPKARALVKDGDIVNFGLVGFLFNTPHSFYERLNNYKRLSGA